MEPVLNTLWLGLKEIKSLLSDKVLMAFVVYAFTLSIYSQATGTSNEVNNASIAFADEDSSALSKEMFESFYPPRFQRPVLIRRARWRRDGQGKYMFVVTIPNRFERDLREGPASRDPAQHRRHGHAAGGIGSNYIKQHRRPAHQDVPLATDADAISRSGSSSGSCSTRTGSRPGSRASWRSSTSSLSDHRLDRSGRDPRARARARSSILW
jgi:hypothetical protein